MTKEEMEFMERGYKEGYWQAYGDAMKLALNLIKKANESRILPPDKVFLCADLQLQAKEKLMKKGYMPYDYDVITGKAEHVDAPWEN